MAALYRPLRDLFGLEFKMRLTLPILLLSLASCGPKTPGRGPDEFIAQFDTTQGTFKIKVERAWSPLGADRFYQLVSGGFYNGARFFRTLPKFVVQWGISADPTVSKSWKSGKAIQDDPVLQSNLRGFLSFATSGPNTRTTQVFVNMRDNARLDARGFSPFGKVVEGMEVFDKFHSGYGEGAPRGGGPDQDKIEAEGETYLAREYPMLDKIVTARIAPK